MSIEDVLVDHFESQGMEIADLRSDVERLRAERDEAHAERDEALGEKDYAEGQLGERADFIEALVEGIFDVSGCETLGEVRDHLVSLLDEHRPEILDVVGEVPPLSDWEPS